MPRCEDLYDAIGAVTTLKDFNGDMSTTTHQPIHMFTGGQVYLYLYLEQVVLLEKK